MTILANPINDENQNRSNINGNRCFFNRFTQLIELAFNFYFLPNFFAVRSFLFRKVDNNKKRARKDALFWIL